MGSEVPEPNKEECRVELSLDLFNKSLTIKKRHLARQVRKL